MAKVIFNAKPKQIQLAAALAANAAAPQGLGHLHYDAGREFTADDMKPFWIDKREFKADYVQGRCCKFGVWDAQLYTFNNEAKGYKWMTGYETQDHYETWRTKYPTYVDLLQAAGITDYKVIGQ